MLPFLSQARYRPESDRPRFPHFTRTHTDSLVISDRESSARKIPPPGFRRIGTRTERGIDISSLESDDDRAVIAQRVLTTK